jgi:hypothetical protein
MENQYNFKLMLLLLDVYGFRCVANYMLLPIVKSPNMGYIVLYNKYMIISFFFYLHPIDHYKMIMDMSRKILQ